MQNASTLSSESKTNAHAEEKHGAHRDEENEAPHASVDREALADRRNGSAERWDTREFELRRDAGPDGRPLVGRAIDVNVVDRSVVAERDAHVTVASRSV